MPLLLVFAGLPGSGKSTLAQAAARALPGVWLRVDELEDAMLGAGISADQPTGLAAYRLAQTMAAHCLSAGAHVVADAVNAVEEARQAWVQLAHAHDATLRFVEARCADPAEHRRRVEERDSPWQHMPLPSWSQVQARESEFSAWQQPHLEVNTCLPLEETLAQLLRYAKL